MIRSEPPLADLYLEDETAWLDAMAEQIQLGNHADLDYAHLGEYLTDMASRDRREVRSRLKVLLVHILKWVHQPDKRSRSWKSSIIHQRHELIGEAGTGVLRNHAASVLSDVYSDAVELAAAETGLSIDDFPAVCAYSLEDLFNFDPTP